MKETLVSTVRRIQLEIRIILLYGDQIFFLMAFVFYVLLPFSTGIVFRRMEALNF